MSTLRTNTLSNAAGSASVPVDTVISGSAKAWVNFNGTGTVAIRTQFNVSSITDNGTGDYTVNFTTAFADANYSVSLAASTSNGVTNQIASANSGSAPTTMSTTQVRVSHVSTAGTFVDTTTYCVAVFR
jgi:hypothetical protein